MEIIKITHGERKLLSLDKAVGGYNAICLNGYGHVRLMSQAERILFKSGDSMLLMSDEIITVSAMEDMVIKLQPEKYSSLSMNKR